MTPPRIPDPSLRPARAPSFLLPPKRHLFHPSNPSQTMAVLQMCPPPMNLSRGPANTSPHDMAAQVQEQAIEIAALKARLATLEPSAMQTHPASSAPPPNNKVLFADQATIDHARVAAAASREESHKPLLPDPVPGFKSSPLNIGKSCPSLIQCCDGPSDRLPAPHSALLTCLG